MNTLSCDFFPAKCYYLTLKKNNFSLIFTSYFFPLRYATSLLAIRCYVGGDRGVKLFDLGCPALLPPALGPTGGLWRHLGPLGGYYKAPVWPSPLRQRG